MAPHLLSQATEGLRVLLGSTCQADLPCASATAVSATSELFHHEAVSPSISQDDDGQSAPGSQNLPDEHVNDRVYWFASCTKLITAIARMQLVEQNKLALDDEYQLEGLCPEL